MARDERLQYAPTERPPAFDPAVQPVPPAEQWNEERLLKANRNYAIEFVRNGIVELRSVLGDERTTELGGLAARLIGLQYYPHLAASLDGVDGDARHAGEFLVAAFEGMGDEVDLAPGTERSSATVTQRTLRIVRGMEGAERDVLLKCWIELWRGALRSHRILKTLEVTHHEAGLTWHLRDETPPGVVHQ
ncbi:MAG: hypothetical protein K0U93_16990 [Gammaproteobacteria bacterium]|nr:hypothetical protein [Gammaproteobacteria bacterium]